MWSVHETAEEISAPTWSQSGDKTNLSFESLHGYYIPLFPWQPHYYYCVGSCIAVKRHTDHLISISCQMI